MRPAHRHVTQTRTRATRPHHSSFSHTRRKFSTHLVTASSVLLSQDKQLHVPFSTGRAPGCRHGRAPSGGMQRRKSRPSTSTPWNKRRLWRRFRAPQQSRCPPCTTSVPRARGPKFTTVFEKDPTKQQLLELRVLPVTGVAFSLFCCVIRIWIGLWHQHGG